MASRMIVNKYETYKNLKENKIEEGEKKELIRRDNYEKDLESLERREKELKNIKGENTEINFGSQIRTYTMCPYTLVKDHRTLFESANVEKILDGDLNEFIYENLKLGVR